MISIECHMISPRNAKNMKLSKFNQTCYLFRGSIAKVRWPHFDTKNIGRGVTQPDSTVCILLGDMWDCIVQFYPG